MSHETVYQTLYLQARGELRTELKLALRRGRTRRVNRSRPAVARGTIRDMVNISERPKEAEDRAAPGFWEGDLIIGKDGDQWSMHRRLPGLTWDPNEDSDRRWSGRGPVANSKVESVSGIIPGDYWDRRGSSPSATSPVTIGERSLLRLSPRHWASR